MREAQPGLLEPMYRGDVQAPSDVMAAVYDVVTRRNAEIVDDRAVGNTPLRQLTVHLRVRKAFGFAEELKRETRGRAYPQLVFDHYALVDGELDEERSELAQLVAAVRAEKMLLSGAQVTYGNYKIE